MGTRAGDNNQLLALAEGLGWPFVQKPIAYNQLRRFPLLRKGLTIVAEKSRALIAPPWPDLVRRTGVTISTGVQDQGMEAETRM